MNMKNKWNHAYSQKTDPGSPAAVLLNHQTLLPASGIALDIACGQGANALFLAERGLAVDAWDISDVAIRQLRKRATSLGLSINARVVDITARTLEGPYDVIVNCHYLDRSIIHAMKSALVPGGLLFFQTFTGDKRLDIGPTREAFLLRKDELREMFGELTILDYRDESGCEDIENPLAGRACILVRKG